MRLLILQSIKDSFRDCSPNTISADKKKPNKHKLINFQLMQMSWKTKTFVGKTLWNSVYHISQQSTLGQISHRTEIKISWDICVPMFTAALFTITKVWKQTKCPSVNEWIRKHGCIHTYLALIGIILSLKKKEKFYHL